MTAEQNLAASKRFFEEAWSGGNLGVFDELCAADCVDHDLTAHEDVVGLEANKARVRAYREGVPDLRVNVEDAFASGNEVVIRWRAEGTHDGNLFGLPATHRAFAITGISIDRWAGDKLVEAWDQWDQTGMLEQLGVNAEAFVQTG
jgi:steroid delta-isomerase-like uncharacterized protein